VSHYYASRNGGWTFPIKNIRKKLGGNIVQIGKKLAGTTNPIGTGTGTGI
jgi:hypothetical protein